MPRALAVLAVTAALAAPAAAQTADEIVARSIEARGGLAAIKAVQSVRMTGRIKIGADSLPIVVEMRRGAGLRTEITTPDGRLAVQGFDGRRAWAVEPGGTQAEELPAAAARQMAQQADFEGPLVDYKSKGHRVELVGTARSVTGRQYRLRVTLKDGDADDYLIDETSLLLVRVESKREMAGELVEGETNIKSYEDAGGWKWPRVIENGVKGREERQTISFDKVEVNPVLDDARFKLPVGAAPATGRRPGR